MSNLSPIQTIADPAFTESAKGLMILFCIGLFHIVVGVDITDAKIAVPWFPSINFERPNHLIYLYWAFTFYGIYRYTLHSVRSFREQRTIFLHRILNSKIGNLFLKKYIVSPASRHHKVKISQDEGFRKISISQEVEIEVEPDEIRDSPYKIFCYFSFLYDANFHFYRVSFKEIYLAGMQIPTLCNDEKNWKKWGLDKNLPLHTSEGMTFFTNAIPSLTLRLQLNILIVLGLTISIFTNKSTFDLVLPIFLNLGLFIAWLSI